MIPTCTILKGDCLQVLKTLPDESVHCVVTSPPYWGLRDYGVEGQLGLEKMPEEYVAKMVAVFREVRRVLRKDGTAWVNMGDSYTGSGKGGNPEEGKQATNKGSQTIGVLYGKTGDTARQAALTNVSRRWTSDNGMAPKNLVGIPWRLAFALQADGWWLRQDIIWHKPNPMPESVTDRCTKAHEYLFLLAKSDRYFFDAEAIKEPSAYGGYKDARAFGGKNGEQISGPKWDGCGDPARNRRSVWTINSEPYPESHFATFPTALVKPCILAGTSAKGCCPKCGAPWERVVEQVPPPKCHRNPPRPGMTGNDQMAASLRANGDNWNGPEMAAWRANNPAKESWRPTCECGYKNHLNPCTVLDPFGGSGTTGQVAIELGRSAILIELNPAYVKLAEQRTNVTPGFAMA